MTEKIALVTGAGSAIAHAVSVLLSVSGVKAVISGISYERLETPDGLLLCLLLGM